jgi:hypothetical protein
LIKNHRRGQSAPQRRVRAPRQLDSGTATGQGSFFGQGHIECTHPSAHEIEYPGQRFSLLSDPHLAAALETAPRNKALAIHVGEGFPLFVDELVECLVCRPGITVHVNKAAVRPRQESLSDTVHRMMASTTGWLKASV